VSGLYSQIITKRSLDGYFRVKIKSKIVLIPNYYIQHMISKRLADLKYIEKPKYKQINLIKFKKSVMEGIKLKQLASNFKINANHCKKIVNDLNLSKFMLS